MRLPASLALFALLLAVTPRPGEAGGSGSAGAAAVSRIYLVVSVAIADCSGSSQSGIAERGERDDGLVTSDAECDWYDRGRRNPPPAPIAAEARYGVPTGLLQAIGLVESGRRDEVTGRREPWPWAINAEGEPHFFETKQQAVAWVRQAQSRGMQSIDVGCAQVNLMTTQPPLLPGTGLRSGVQCRLRRALSQGIAGHDRRRKLDDGSGPLSLADSGAGQTYRQQVVAAMAGGPVATSPARMFASALAPSSPFGSVELARPPGGGLGGRSRVGSCAASGTVGRGLDAYRAMPVQMAVVIRPVPVAAPR